MPVASQVVILTVNPSPPGALSSLDASNLPAFSTDEAADVWLRANSAYYRMMATAVDSRCGYTFRRTDRIAKGLASVEGGKFVIDLSDSLLGSERVSILIFELTNCYQGPQHQEIDKLADTGKITTAREFGILHELVELDGLRYHRLVLEELNRLLGSIPPDMMRWINPNCKNLSDYKEPLAYSFLKAQTSGHIKNYYEEFQKRANWRKASQRKGKSDLR